MPWIVGIDEAGYGPNLGPFVMTSVAMGAKESHVGADHWNVFNSVARRHSDPDDTRFVVADSKLVYAPGDGLMRLEHTVQAALHAASHDTLAGLVDCISPDCHEDLRREVWYDGTTALPLEAHGAAYRDAGRALAACCQGLEICWGPVRSVVVCPTEFNALTIQGDSKGAVLAFALVRLLRALPRNEEPVHVFIDKHGGRNCYTAVLQPAFDDGMVIGYEEGSQRSCYEVIDGKRRFELTIEPRADASHFCVALASMVSKYLRELLMLEFNRFWQAKLPGLKPTAGYPTDARRFWSQIRETAEKLGLAEDSLWRQR